MLFSLTYSWTPLKTKLWWWDLVSWFIAKSKSISMQEYSYTNTLINTYTTTIILWYKNVYYHIRHISRHHNYYIITSCSHHLWWWHHVMQWVCLLTAAHTLIALAQIFPLVSPVDHVIPTIISWHHNTLMRASKTLSCWIKICLLSGVTLTSTQPGIQSHCYWKRF